MKIGSWKLNPELKKGCKLPDNVQKAFNEATGGMTGAKYVPVAFIAYQKDTRVSGFRLICLQSMKGDKNESMDRLVLMKVLIPMDGRPAVLATLRPFTVEANFEK